MTYTPTTLIPAGTRVWINRDGQRVQAMIEASCKCGGYFVLAGGRSARISGDQIIGFI